MLHLLINGLLYGAGIGLLCCTGFLVLLLAAVIRFRRRPQLPPPSSYPAVSLLKPLCGLEPNLESNLRSFFEQDYPDFEIVFGTRDDTDPALAVARRLHEQYPRVAVKFVYSGQPKRPNAKVCSLEAMIAAASHEYLVMSDSDVIVTGDYTKSVVRPLLDPQVGLVTCVYRGVSTGTIWSRLDALGMSVEMTSGVIVADMLEGMKFALGPTIAARRQVLDAVGGMGSLDDYLAEDFVLGDRVHASGRTVVLSACIIDQVAFNRGFRDSMGHQVRWMRSTRFSRPKGHVGTGLTFAIPFGLLGLVAGIAGRHPRLGVALFAAAVLNRMIMSVAAGWGAVRDRYAVAYCWLYPVRDLMGFCFWVMSFLGTTVVWRNDRYRLLPGGKIVRVSADSASRPVAVDDLA
jgi:ceramide glucosyltransferase